MKKIFRVVVVVTACFMSGCSSLQRTDDITTQNTKKIALLIQDIQDSTTRFQRQRNAIAVASKSQRNAMEALALRQELNAYRTTAAWDIAGHQSRTQAFAALHAASSSLLERLDAQRASALAHERDLQQARSAVQIQGAKLNEAAVILMKLAEPTDKEQSQFYWDYVMEVRELIKKDSEAAAASNTSVAQAQLDADRSSIVNELEKPPTK